MVPERSSHLERRIDPTATTQTGSKLMQVCSLIQELGYRDLTRLGDALFDTVANGCEDIPHCVEGLVKAAEKINPKHPVQEPVAVVGRR
jgi:hypothetical protein